MRIKFFVLVWIILVSFLLGLGMVVTDSTLPPISVERNNYQIDDTVNLSINIDPANYTAYYLMISALNNNYTYKGDFNPVMFFYPTEEGIYTIALVEKSTGAIFYSLSVNVSANETSVPNVPKNVIYENISSSENISAEPGQEGLLISQSSEQNETSPEINTMSTSSSLISTDKKEYLVGEKVSVYLDLSNVGQVSLYHSFNGVSQRYMGDLGFIRFIPEGVGTHSLILQDANGNIISKYDFEVSSGLAERSIEIINSIGSAEAVGMNFLEEKGGFGSFDIPLNKKSLKKLRLNNLQFSKGNTSLNLSIGVDDVPPERFNMLRITRKRVIKAFAIDSENLNFTNGTATAVAVGNELWKCKQWDFLAQQCLGVWEKVMDLTPGVEYDIELSQGDPGYAETGVASINTKKPIYHPGERAEIVMAVLDTEGHLVSHADVSLIITAPDNTTTTLTTSNGEITETDKGIYETTYSNTIWEGNYSLEVRATGSNVDSTIFSFFSVKPYYEFDILRETPVTTDPWQGAFTSNIRIISYTDITTFNFTEVLPSNFEIIDSGGALVATTNNRTYLTWINLNNDSLVSYSTRPPQITPELYSLGPSFVSYDNNIFYEARPWYLAVDPEVQYLYDDCNGAGVNGSLWYNITSGGVGVYASGGYYYLNASTGEYAIATNNSKTDFKKYTADASLQKVAGNGRGWVFGIGTGALWGQTFCQSNTGWSPTNGYAVCFSFTSPPVIGSELVKINNAVATSLMNSTWEPNNVSFYNFTFILNSSGVFFYVNNTRILNSTDTTYSQGYITISTGGGGANQGRIMINNVWYYERTVPTVNINTSLDGLSTNNSRPNVDFNFIDSYSSTANCSLYFNNTPYNFTPNVNNNTQKSLKVNTSLADSNYSVYVNCTNTYGDIGKSSIIHILIDTTGPVLSLGMPANFTNITTLAYTLNASVSDLTGVDTVTFLYRANTSDTWHFACSDADHSAPYNCSWNLVGLPDGKNYQVMAYANDTLGALGNNDTHINITVDTNGPVVVLNFPVNFTNITTNTYMLNASANDFTGVKNVTFMYRINASDTWKFACSDNVTPYNCTWNVTTLTDGKDYQITVFAYDIFGTLGNNDTHTNITIDRTGPNTTIDHPANFTNITTNTYMLNATVTDMTGVSKVTFLFRLNATDTWKSACNDSAGPPYNCTWDLTSLPDGKNYQIQAYANDTFGTLGNNDTHGNITVDRTGPNSSIGRPANNSVIDVRSSGYIYMLNATVNDSLSGIGVVTFMYRMNSSDTWKLACQDTDHAFPYNCTWNLTSFNNSFNYQVMVYANDSLGNMGLNDTHINITILTHFINISSMLFDDDVSIPINQIDLQAGTIKSVYCNFTILDPVDYTLIQGVNATIYSVLNMSNSTDNNRSHYSNSSCALITGSGQSADYQCMFNVWHFAINGTWNCTARAWNSYSNITLNDNTTLNQLFALNISTSVIDYANLQPNQTSQNVTVNISNVGNMPMNISVYGFGGDNESAGTGLSMLCQINNISISFERFSTNTTSNYSSKRQLLGSPQDLGLTIPTKTNASDTRVNSTYWQFMVPPQAQSFGQCNGSVVFMAQSP